MHTLLSYIYNIDPVATRPAITVTPAGAGAAAKGKREKDEFRIDA